MTPEPAARPARARWWIVGAALVALAASLVGLDARATNGARVTADEPQYLLTAQSLADDLDLDIADEIAERAYLPYHEITIDRQTSVLDDGREVSPHDPLLPALLAIPMAVGGWALAKATLAVIAALTAAVTAWTAIRRFGVAAPVAGAVTAAAFAGIPLAAYGGQVYPELPAALATTVATAALLTPGPVGRRHLVVILVGIVALPWLAVKYVPVAAVLGLALLHRTRTDRARTVRLAVALGMAGLAYVVLHRVWYGGWTVYATGDHFETTGEFSVVGTRVDLLGRSRRLVGLLVDREFGIAAWQPLWFVLPPALGWVAARRSFGGWLLAGLVAVGWLNATFVALTMHGWWVPGRQLVVVLPAAVVAVAIALDHHRRLLVVTVLAGVAGAVNWVWLAIEASTGRRTLVVDFWTTAALPYRALRPVLPSGLRDDPVDVAVLVVWTIVVAVATGAAAAVRRHSSTNSGSTATGRSLI